MCDPEARALTIRQPRLLMHRRGMFNFSGTQNPSMRSESEPIKKNNYSCSTLSPTHAAILRKLFFNLSSAEAGLVH